MLEKLEDQFVDERLTLEKAALKPSSGSPESELQSSPNNPR